MEEITVVGKKLGGKCNEKGMSIQDKNKEGSTI